MTNYQLIDNFNTTLQVIIILDLKNQPKFIEMLLEQKQGFKKRSFEIIGDKLKIIDKSSKETKEWTINLDSIGNEILIVKGSRTSGIIAGALLLAFGIFFIAVNLADRSRTLAIGAWIAIGLFYLFIGILVFATPVKKEIHLIGGLNPTTFFLDSPSKKEVDEFIQILIQRSKTILLEKYGKVDIDLPEETAMNQFNWLKNRSIITEDEYKRLKADYKTRKIINK